MLMYFERIIIVLDYIEELARRIMCNETSLQIALIKLFTYADTG